MHFSPHKTWIFPYCSHGANILVGRKKVNKYTNKHNKGGDKCYDLSPPEKIHFMWTPRNNLFTFWDGFPIINQGSKFYK